MPSTPHLYIAIQDKIDQLDEEIALTEDKLCSLATQFDDLLLDHISMNIGPIETFEVDPGSDK